jgi:hypothetical protein
MRLARRSALPASLRFLLRTGQRPCDRCQVKEAPRRRIYMHFMLREGRHCQFLEEDLKTPLPGKITFADPAKVMDKWPSGAAAN